MKNKGGICQNFSKENHIANDGGLPASTYDCLICAERHAIFESLRMVLIEEHILAIIIKENGFSKQRKTCSIAINLKPE